MADENKNEIADFLDDTEEYSPDMEGDPDDLQDGQEDSELDEMDDLDDEGDDSDDSSDDDDSDDGDVDGEGGDSGEGEKTKTSSEQEGQGAQEQIRILTELVSKLTQQQLKTEEKPTEKKEPADPFKGESFKALQEVLDLDDSEMAIMASFLQEMNESTKTSSVEQALELTPEVVTQQMNTKAVITNAKEKFYTENPALVPVQDYVRVTANAIAEQNPGFSIKQVLDTAADTVYKTLSIEKAPAEKAAKPGKRKPAFAKGTTGSRKKTKNKKSKAATIMDLFD